MFNQLQSSNHLDTKLSNTASTALTASPIALDTRNLSGLNFQNRANSSSELNTSLNTSGSTQSTKDTTSITGNKGDSIGTAVKWAPLNSRTHYTYGKSIGGSDKNDYFQFSLNTKNDFNLVMSGFNTNVDVSLLDGSGNTIKYCGNAGTHGDVYKVGTSEALNTTLQAGTYYLKVSSFDNLATNYKIDFLATQSTSTPDCYTPNLENSSIRNWTRQFYNDGQLNRNEMMTIFRSTMDNGVINASELNDLRKVINSFSMPNYVHVLSDKIVNGNAANNNSGIGNLFAGASANQMEKLIGKWFMGTDHPTADGTYQRVNGSLFQNGINYTDVKQGYVGDCYFMASLATVAQRTPDSIRNMFTDNGDGTFTVRFFTNGAADYVTVDRYLPTDAGNAHYASWGDGLSNSTGNKLWVALAEKAYAQINESGAIGHGNTNSYSALDGGQPYLSLNHITGRATTQRDIDHHFLFFGSDDVGHIADACTQGRSVVLNTKSDVASTVVHNHSYSVVSYNPSTDKFIVYNPWGVDGGRVSGDPNFKPGFLEVTRKQMIDNFQSWDAVA